MTEVTGEMLLERYVAGLSLADIEKVTGLSRSDLSRRLRTVDPDYVKSKRWRSRRRRAFIRYVKGSTLRAIANEENVRFPSVWYWFSQMSRQYATIARQGVFASVGEYLTSRDARQNPDKALSVETWLYENLPSLIASEDATSTVTYSAKKERAFTRKECGSLMDYRAQLKY